MKNTERFSNRVENYIRYRPHYPNEIIDFLAQQYDISPTKKITDIGAGTGISTEMFLKSHYTVKAVEPNLEMRTAMTALLSTYSGFTAIDGTAENTHLKDHSIDMVFCAQAFHWFDREKAKVEIQRILKPKGVLALVWNERSVHDAFEKAYDRLIEKYAIDYTKVQDRKISEKDIAAFFQPFICEVKTFANHQFFDFEGLKGRLLSSSYTPLQGHETYDSMLEDLKILFDQFQKNGQICIHYDTHLYSGIFA